MKKQSNTLFPELGKQAVTNLTTIVDETLSLGSVKATPKRVFTAAELWNIQRQRRSFVQRRSIF